MVVTLTPWLAPDMTAVLVPPADHSHTWGCARHCERIIQSGCRTAHRRGGLRQRSHVIKFLRKEIRQLTADENRGIVYRGNLGRVSLGWKGKCRSRGGSRAVIVEDGAFVIDRVANAMTNNTISFSCLMVHLLCNLSHWNRLKAAPQYRVISHTGTKHCRQRASRDLSFVRGSQ